MRILVVGSLVADTIEHPDGRVTESLGGIAHTAAALSTLAGERHEIALLCRIGEDCRAWVTAWAAQLPGLDLANVCWMASPSPRVRLSYGVSVGTGERIERLTNVPAPLHADDVRTALGRRGADIALVNCVSGSDCTVEAVAAAREGVRHVFLDVHSMTLGTASDGTRYLRRRDDWDDWLRHADTTQSNLAEARLVCGLAADAAEDAVVDAAQQRLAAARGVGGGGVWLVTLGARGAWVIEVGPRARAPERLPAPAIEALDPTGAGDAFGAGYVAAWLDGATPLEAARSGVRCGSAASLVRGAPTPMALRSALRVAQRRSGESSPRDPEH